MTPLGEKLREMRGERGITQKEMAQALNISNAYLSALEHGHRGQPSWAMLQRIITYFNVIWDEAETLVSLAELSHPKITIDTGGLSPQATELVNIIARDIKTLTPDQVAQIKIILDSTT
jgi:transcriptional regulator with XRE-family HTH domain